MGRRLGSVRLAGCFLIAIAIGVRRIDQEIRRHTRRGIGQRVHGGGHAGHPWRDCSTIRRGRATGANARGQSRRRRMQLLPRWHTFVILVQAFGVFERDLLLVGNHLFS